MQEQSRDLVGESFVAEGAAGNAPANPFLPRREDHEHPAQPMRLPLNPLFYAAWDPVPRRHFGATRARGQYGDVGGEMLPVKLSVDLTRAPSTSASLNSRSRYVSN